MAKTVEEISGEIADQMVRDFREKGVAQGLNEKAIADNSPALMEGMKKAVVQAAEENPALFADNAKSREQAEFVAKILEREQVKYAGAHAAIKNIAGAKHRGLAGWAGAETIANKIKDGAKDGLRSILASRSGELSASYAQRLAASSGQQPNESGVRGV